MSDAAGFWGRTAARLSIENERLRAENRALREQATKREHDEGCAAHQIAVLERACRCGRSAP